MICSLIFIFRIHAYQMQVQALFQPLDQAQIKPLLLTQDHLKTTPAAPSSAAATPKSSANFKPPERKF